MQTKNTVSVGNGTIINAGDLLEEGRPTQKGIAIIPAPFKDSALPSAFAAVPLTVPSDATFPDGTRLAAYRIDAKMILDHTYETGEEAAVRIYALRLQDELYIFAPEGEEATAAALALAAQVDPGVPLTIGDPVKAFYLNGGTNAVMTEGSAKQ